MCSVCNVCVCVCVCVCACVCACVRVCVCARESVWRVRVSVCGGYEWVCGGCE